MRRSTPLSAGSLIFAAALLAACGDKAAAPNTPDQAAAPQAATPVTAQVHQTRSVPVTVQGITDVGATVRVKNVDLGEDATIVDVNISFASKMTNSVKMATDDTFIETPDGQRLMLKSPDGNPNMTIANGESMNGRLVFMGAVPADADSISLVFNQGSSSDSIIGPYLRIAIPLTAAGVAAR